MMPRRLATSPVCATSRSSAGRIGKMSPMPMASRVTAERMTNRALFTLVFPRKNERRPEAPFNGYGSDA